MNLSISEPRSFSLWNPYATVESDWQYRSIWLSIKFSEENIHLPVYEQILAVLVMLVCCAWTRKTFLPRVSAREFFSKMILETCQPIDYNWWHHNPIRNLSWSIGLSIKCISNYEKFIFVVYSYLRIEYFFHWSRLGIIPEFPEWPRPWPFLIQSSLRVLQVIDYTGSHKVTLF